MCDTCGRLVVLARRLGGGTLQIDPQPDPAGEVVLSPAGIVVGRGGLTVNRQPSAVVLGAKLRRELDPSVPRYRNHLWSCPGKPERGAGGRQTSRRGATMPGRGRPGREEAAVGDNGDGAPLATGVEAVVTAREVSGGVDVPSYEAAFVVATAPAARSS